ncbi:pyridoxamine 5'-phosphate oxidase family protein [Halovenus sp. WSH3]|uniref:Pyridoxamine 5'-phosphate oxidase family protein n=1 Tax=Halovenus carboxidivorans TaxID=2692199 RepID=A0A6B0T680_9EURY|nr:pyridoxamine 5'-phosphate oxidase family protein [Halovenus carboxidivorans]MXR52427.1 pyridoxamine 5'-phosphate oxidase family protein [Halovenus carboxidivorans]
MSDTDGDSPKTTAKTLLEETRTCTLATASPDGVPEAATVRFVSDDDLDLYVTTESMYRKCDNMRANPAVAVVVDGTQGNLQLSGTATEIGGRAVDEFERRYLDKYGPSPYLTDEESVFFRIETDWGRLLVDGTYPPTYEMILGDGQTDPLG